MHSGEPRGGTDLREIVTVSDGTRIAVHDYGGSGRPIVLLHGLMGRASTWWGHARWLADHGRVVALDARGHGGTVAATSGPWSTERFVDDVVAVLEALELASAVLIGHSMGGLHAWQTAATRPDLVDAIVVEDMAPDHRGRTAASWEAWLAAMPQTFDSIASVREAFSWPRPSVGDYIVECVREHSDGYRLITDHGLAASIASEWGERDFWAGVRAVRCPALLLQAEETPIASAQMAEMATQMSDARHVLIAGTGHLLHDDAPGRFRELVTGFLNRTAE
ncbi:MAG TPA: alpha/beta hydrolase [Pseudonocardia sp.]|nr:alpha/beta hydrolase [Pseudonocardia sp.]